MKASRIINQVKRGFTLIELLVVIAILASLGAVGYGVILAMKNAGDIQAAQQNVKQIGQLLSNFKEEYKSFPDDNTADRILDKSKNVDFGELTGDYSNCYFRQMFHSNKVDSTVEENFFATIACGGAQSKKGDNSIARGQCLEAGENAFAYVMQVSKDNDKKTGVRGSGDPLLVCAVYPAQKPYEGGKIDYDGKSFSGDVFVYYTNTAIKKVEGLEPDDDDDEKLILPKGGKSIFPESKSGKDRTGNFVVLPPQFN